jgi:endonuclease YncB( thermonuclease family)
VVHKILLLLAFTAPAIACQPDLIFPVTSVTDGDTIKGTLHLLPMPLNTVSIRLKDIDTPERGGYAKCDKERELAEQAKQLTTKLIGNNPTIIVRNYSYDKYGGRILGDVFVGEVNVKYELTKAGLATPYFGYGEKRDWCK